MKITSITTEEFRWPRRLKARVDGLWETLRPVLQHVEVLERVWNDFALCAAE